jgi:hypothetical protein
METSVKECIDGTCHELRCDKCRNGWLVQIEREETATLEQMIKKFNTLVREEPFKKPVGRRVVAVTDAFANMKLTQNVKHVNINTQNA